MHQGNLQGIKLLWSAGVSRMLMSLQALKLQVTMMKVPEIFQIKHNRLVPESTLGDLFSIVFVVCAPQMPSKLEGI